MNADTSQPPNITLEQLLNRSDIWRGHAHHFTGGEPGVSTGYAALDEALLHGGWPRGALVEICQDTFQAEWTLLGAAIRANTTFTVLLNPPSQPFVQSLLQQGVDLDRLLVVEAQARSDFIGCFTELARAAGCGALVAWQPREPLTYTDLRRCALAVSGTIGIYWVFRPSTAQQQSSPAALRLFCKRIPEAIEVTIFKQKGWLKQLARPLHLPLPQAWSGFERYNAATALAEPQRSGESAGASRGLP